jgi:hypothetical protein
MRLLYILGRCSLRKTFASRAFVPQRLKTQRKYIRYRSGEPLHPITPRPGVTGTLRHTKSENAFERDIIQMPVVGPLFAIGGSFEDGAADGSGLLGGFFGVFNF